MEIDLKEFFDKYGKVILKFAFGIATTLFIVFVLGWRGFVGILIGQISIIYLLYTRNWLFLFLSKIFDKNTKKYIDDLTGVGK